MSQCESGKGTLNSIQKQGDILDFFDSIAFVPFFFWCGDITFSKLATGISTMTMMMRLLVGRPAFQNVGCQVFKCSRRAISSANLTIEPTTDPSGFENRPANKDLTFGTVRYACQSRHHPLRKGCFDDSGPNDCHLLRSRQSGFFCHFVLRSLCAYCFSRFASHSLLSVVDTTDIFGSHANYWVDDRGKVGQTQDYSLSGLEA